MLVFPFEMQARKNGKGRQRSRTRDVLSYAEIDYDDDDEEIAFLLDPITYENLNDPVCTRLVYILPVSYYVVQFYQVLCNHLTRCVMSLCVCMVTWLSVCLLIFQVWAHIFSFDCARVYPAS